MANWTGKRVNVSYVKNEEPSFLKEFKKKVGYKEGKGLEDKVRLSLSICIYLINTQQSKFIVLILFLHN